MTNLKVVNLIPKEDPACVQAKLLQSCLTICSPMVYSPPGFSVHGILQARILEWVAMPSSRESSHPGIEPACLACLLCVCSIGRKVLYL